MNRVYFFCFLIPLFLLPSSISSQGICDPRDFVIEKLRREHNEVLTVRGLIGEHWIMEILASPNGSFTIIKTDRNGFACHLASGVGLEMLHKTGQET